VHTAKAAAKATATPNAGGVKGATVVLAKPAPKSTHGVLGTTATLGKSVAGAKLPFTGLSLWIFVAGAALLLGLGAVIRRSTNDQL
jgi:hypothetical protein